MANRLVCFDLDDTLYKEIDYLKSAYREISVYAIGHCQEDSMPLAAKAYATMFAAYLDGENAFEKLNIFLGLDIPVREYLKIYRGHFPDITLSMDTVLTLDALKSSGYVIGLISDGRSLQQRNKIGALGLQRWIRAEDMVISEEFGHEKPCLDNYKLFESRFPECEEFVYVGDNPVKDFIAPNILGWRTICLKDDGRNIHRQDFDTISVSAQPETIVKSLPEIFLYL